ncbi:MAG: NfeD family protein [Woeseiaceae bacterium]|nr:NfeD family protein [Woeseiaceae bacterium]
MKRYSVTWWLAILPTTIVVGVPVFLLLDQQTDLGLAVSLAVALACALLGDLAIAAWMERIAPTKVCVGPGERLTDGEIPSDEAIVLSGFNESAEGRVSVRGETWAAARQPGDTVDLVAGTTVRIVDRDGLRLLVSTSPG